MEITLGTFYALFYRFVCEHEWHAGRISRECLAHREWAESQHLKAKDTNYLVAQRQLMDDHKRKATIFAAACIENFVNSIGVMYMGEAGFAPIERKRFSEKIAGIFAHRGITIDLESTGIQKWTEIMKRRNDLMHNKVRTENIQSFVDSYLEWRDESFDFERQSILAGLQYLHSLDRSIDDYIAM